MIFPKSPPSNLVKCRSIHVVYLTDKMREDEREQFCALAYQDKYDADFAARMFIAKNGPNFCLVDNQGLALCAGGFEPIAPGIFQSWMLGSYEGWKNWRAITKGSRWLMGVLLSTGASRLQGSCLSSRTEALEWFRRGLGMDYEGTSKGFGFHGEDMMNFAVVRRV